MNNEPSEQLIDVRNLGVLLSSCGRSDRVVKQQIIKSKKLVIIINAKQESSKIGQR